MTTNRVDQIDSLRRDAEVELTEAISDVRGALDLDQLCRGLNRTTLACRALDERVEGWIDLPSLPTYGGEQPGDTEGVYSWDAARLLGPYGASTTDEATRGPWCLAPRD